MIRGLVRRCLSLAVLVSITAPSSAVAEIQRLTPIFLVNLSAPERGFTALRASSLDEALADLVLDPKNVIEPGDRVDLLLSSCKPDENGRPQPPTPIVRRLYECAECLRAFSETRFATNRSDTVMLVVLYDAQAIPDSRAIATVFEEAARDSELIATGKALLSLIRKETQPQGAQPACLAVTHTLQYKRSHLKITVGVRRPADEAPPRAATNDPLMQPTPRGPNAADLVSPQYILGPGERWFFSTDFVFSKASVQINKTPTVPAELVKSKDFFIGLNFAFADLLADRASSLQRRSFLKELVLKAQVTPSRHPWEAWAVGIGLRGYGMRTILWNMDVVHPYITVGRQTLEGDERRWRVGFGLGFDPRSFER